VLSDGTWQPTERGSPQGGVVSPLLALIALHRLETAITTAFRNFDRPHVVVYADALDVYWGESVTEIHDMLE
jgi:RNA-directed DNA polymerase